MNRELPVVQAGFRKGRETRDQIANICWIKEKAREFQKNIYFCFIVELKSTVWLYHHLFNYHLLEKAEEPETKLPTSAGSSKKQESSRKTSISALLSLPKPLTVWITINCGKF